MLVRRLPITKSTEILNMNENIASALRVQQKIAGGLVIVQPITKDEQRTNDEFTSVRPYCVNAFVNCSRSLQALKFKNMKKVSTENRKILPTNGIAVVFALVGQPGKQSKNSERLKQNTLEEMFYVLCQCLKMVKEANETISRSSAAVSAKHNLRKHQSHLLIRFVNVRFAQQ